VIDLREHNGIFDKISIALLIFLIIYTPLPFGSVEYPSIFLIEIISAILFFLWMMSLIFRDKDDYLPKENRKKVHFLLRHPWLIHGFRIVTFGKWPTKNTAPNIVIEEDRRSDYFSILDYPIRNTGLEKIGVLFFVLILLQLIPVPDLIQKLISPTTAELYRSAAKITGASAIIHPLSLDPFITFSKFLEYASYFMIFLVVVNTIKTRRHLQVILVAFFVSAVFQGVYGLYEFLSGNQQIFSYSKKFNLDCVTGTFINRNHFAAYLELSMPLLLALVVGRIQRLKLFGGKILVRIAHALETEGSKILLLLFLVTLVVVALVFSLSRSGITFAILSAMVFFFLYYRANNQLSRKVYWIITAAAVIAVSVWIGLDPILERFFRITDQFSDKEARLSLWKNTFNIFLHFPVAGTGAGTFKEVFPMFRTFPTHLSFNEAHNDYLQLLSETGILLVLLLITFFSSMFRRLRKVTKQRFDRIVVIQIGCFCSILSLGLHSLTDFSFQIPAVAVAGIIITALFFGNYHGERSHIQD
jgi:putative inorganic carbon (hco3(-)) transporter